MLKTCCCNVFINDLRMEVNSGVKKHTGVTVQESKEADYPRKSEKDLMILNEQ